MREAWVRLPLEVQLFSLEKKLSQGLCCVAFFLSVLSIHVYTCISLNFMNKCMTGVSIHIFQ